MHSANSGSTSRRLSITDHPLTNASILLGLTISLGTPCFAWESTAIIARSNGSPYVPDVQITQADDNEIALLGEGVDLLTGKRRPVNCVIRAEQPLKIPLGNRDASSSEVVDEQSILQKLNVSVSAKGKFAGYSGSGSYSNSIETRTTSKDVSVILSAALQEYAMVLVPGSNSAAGLPNPTIDLTSNARNLLATSPAKFREVCGDGFVSQVVWGSDFYALFTYSDLDYSEKSTITKTLSISGPGDVFGADANSTLSKEITKHNSKLRIQLIQRGAGADNLATTREELLTLYRELPKTSKEHERPLFMSVVRYTSLPSGKVAPALEMYGQLELMSRNALRLKSLLVDFDDAVAELSGGVMPKYRKFYALSIDGVRQLTGLLKTRDELYVSRETLQVRIRKCLEAQTPEVCKYDTADLDQLQELKLRARAPLPANDVSDEDKKGISYYLDTAKKPEAAGILSPEKALCRIAQIASQKLVLEPANLRCERDGNCSPNKSIVSAVASAYESLGTTQKDCGFAIGAL